MKRIEMCLLLLVAVTLIAAACTSSSDGAVTAEPTAVATPVIPVAGSTSVPTPVPAEAPVASDQDRIDAAVASLDEAPGQPLVAYDLLDSKVDGDIVDLTICGWTGDTVFDDVYTARYQTTAQDDGTVNAVELTTFVTTGECLNTELIDTAIATINAYENYWNDVISAPATFAGDERGKQLLTEPFFELSSLAVERWVDDDIYFDPAVSATDLFASRVADVLWRTVGGPDGSLLEFVFCEEMNPGYGFFRDGALLDDQHSAADSGTHAILAYVLALDPASPLLWRVDGTGTLAWSDCLTVPDWPGAASRWRPGDSDFEVLLP